MKLHAVYLISALALTTAQRVPVENGQAERYLADRDVSASELATHATYADGLWTALDGIVYDITSFVHTPGEKYILRVGGTVADDLYMEAYDERHHPYTIGQVVSQPGITRIGPLVSEGPAAPVSTTDAPVAAPGAPVASEPPVADSTGAPVPADVTPSPEFVFSPISVPTKAPTEAKESKPTEGSTSPPITAAPTSNGSTIGDFFYGLTTMMMVVVSLV